MDVFNNYGLLLSGSSWGQIRTNAKCSEFRTNATADTPSPSLTIVPLIIPPTPLVVNKSRSVHVVESCRSHVTIGNT